MENNPLDLVTLVMINNLGPTDMTALLEKIKATVEANFTVILVLGDDTPGHRLGTKLFRKGDTGSNYAWPFLRMTAQSLPWGTADGWHKTTIHVETDDATPYAPENDPEHPLTAENEANATGNAPSDFTLMHSTSSHRNRVLRGPGTGSTHPTHFIAFHKDINKLASTLTHEKLADLSWALL